MALHRFYITTVYNEKSCSKWGNGSTPFLIFSCRKTIHDNVLSCRKCETICVDCEWNKICYINESKNKKLICWINEQDKILAFHQEEFVQNEFTDRDELRCFLLAVSGIYRIQ